MDTSQRKSTLGWNLLTPFSKGHLSSTTRIASLVKPLPLPPPFPAPPPPPQHTHTHTFEMDSKYNQITMISLQSIYTLRHILWNQRIKIHDFVFLFSDSGVEKRKVSERLFKTGLISVR